MPCITEVNSMDKQQKKRIKKYVSWIALAALVCGLAIMPLVATNEEEKEGPQLSILSGTVKNETITTGLKGGGTLSPQAAEKVLLPSGVKITEFLVDNGDIVAQGDPLASVDRVSVMAAITAVHETMDYLMEEMEDAKDESARSKVVAQAGGYVKAIYAKTGESVQDVMLRDGALAVLSLDGLMAADITADTTFTKGDGVLVRLEDGTEVDGRVDANVEGILTVTIEDDRYPIGMPVQVLTKEGADLGSGALYVHNGWKAVAYTGTVSKINTSVNKEVKSGTNLMSLKDTEFNAQLEALHSQYSDYEALMLDLFRMYQSTLITAPCSGMISGVDTDSIHILCTADEEYSFDLLANAPNGNDDIAYTNFVGIVTGMNDGNWNLSMNPQDLTIPDYTDLSGVPRDPAAMTNPITFIPTAPIYELSGGSWVQIQASAITVGDILLLASDESGNFVWVVRIASAPKEEEPEPSTPPMPTFPPIETTPPTDPTDPSAPTEPPTEPSIPNMPNIPSFPNFPSWGGQFGGMMGGSYPGIGGTQQEDSFQLFDLEGSQLMSVTPCDTMTLAIAVDEHDIRKIETGMTAEITIPALNQNFAASISKIIPVGANNGGSSKFTVELTLPRQEKMLAGMSATAFIALETTQKISVIPVEALVDEGSRTYVYTGYDEKNDVLTNPVDVQLGVSDGIVTEILSGLKSGDTYWYAYYDTLEIDNSADTGFSFG